MVGSDVVKVEEPRFPTFTWWKRATDETDLLLRRGLTATIDRHAIGKGEGRVGQDTIASLRREAANAGLATLAPHCCDCDDVTDLPSVSISHELEPGKPGSISHYLGCGRAPDSLGMLEGYIDDVLAQRFIGKFYERGQAPARGGLPATDAEVIDI